VSTRWNDRLARRALSGPWTDFDDVVSTLEQLRGMFDEGLGTRPGLGLFGATWPRANLADVGNALVLTAEVPGLSDKDVQITLNQGVLTVSGERKTAAPEGFAAYRQERGSLKFSRSFSLPTRVDGERATASVKNGILTVTLEKVADAVPRQIAVTG
jgi:HSP20 family protein